MEITAFVEKGDDGRYSIFSNDSFGNHYFGGYGATKEDAEKDFEESVNEAFVMAKMEKVQIAGLPESGELININYFECKFDKQKSLALVINNVRVFKTKC